MTTAEELIENRLLSGMAVANVRDEEGLKNKLRNLMIEIHSCRNKAQQMRIPSTHLIHLSTSSRSLEKFLNGLDGRETN